MIEIFIPGQPQGKERARSRIITSKSGRQFTSHYTPAKTRQREELIKSYAVGAMRSAAPMAGPVALELRMVFEVPKSWPQWKRDLALTHMILPTVKPDADNIEKSVKDGFNGVVWIDDCQVVSCMKVKCYGPTPGVKAVIREITDKHSAQVTRKDLDASNDDQRDLLSA
ncbi:MAG: RusA family crossover junction endodeoxyribonuclease [Gammaproteobacteria bacterium]|nr:RusA family crossover junction endodeoxyribonuclease [Gammaproteobacteria bacterium]MBU1834200.1 RusA family crossover junction endodeoxyribonuclease [Gammaproteobacteria bacterium]